MKDQAHHREGLKIHFKNGQELIIISVTLKNMHKHYKRTTKSTKYLLWDTFSMYGLLVKYIKESICFYINVHRYILDILQGINYSAIHFTIC